MPFESPEVARAMARKAGQASGQARHKLTLAEVEAALPPALDTPERIRAALELVQRWALAGMIHGIIAGSVVRSCEAALKVYEAEVDRQQIETLEQRVKELEAELAQRQPLRAVP